MTEDHVPDDALNAFWNALNDAEREPALGELDPELAETVRRLLALSRMPPPREIQARADRAMRAQHAVPGTAPGTNGHAPLALRQTRPMVFSGAGRGSSLRSVPHHEERSPQPPAPGRMRFPLVPFITAALLVMMTLTLVSLVFGPGRPGERRGRPSRAVRRAIQGDEAGHRAAGQRPSAREPRLSEPCLLFADTGGDIDLGA